MRIDRESTGQPPRVGRSIELELKEFDWTGAPESPKKNARRGKLHYLWGPPEVKKQPRKVKSNGFRPGWRSARKGKSLPTRPLERSVEEYTVLGRFINDGQRCVAFVTGDALASNDPNRIGMAA